MKRIILFTVVLLISLALSAQVMRNRTLMWEDPDNPDEMGIWVGENADLAVSQRSYLWNNGNGRTLYP